MLQIASTAQKTRQSWLDLLDGGLTFGKRLKRQQQPQRYYRSSLSDFYSVYVDQNGCTYTILISQGVIFVVAPYFLLHQQHSAEHPIYRHPIYRHVQVVANWQSCSRVEGKSLAILVGVLGSNFIVTFLESRYNFLFFF